MNNLKIDNSYIKFLKPEFDVSDERGYLRQLFSNGWRQINYIFSLKNTVRGNHYHIKNKEAFFVISGKFELVITNKDNLKQSFIFNPQEFFMIEPLTIHEFIFLEDTQLISFYDVGVINEDGVMDIHV